MKLDTRCSAYLAPDGGVCLYSDGHDGDHKFSGPESASDTRTEHAVPQDDFQHIRIPQCPCSPNLEYIAWTRVWVHTHIDTCPDFIPEDFFSA